MGNKTNEIHFEGKNNYKTLLAYLHKFYPIGMPLMNNWSEDISIIVSEKIHEKHQYSQNWISLRDGLRSYNLVIRDLSFAQFPSLMLEIEEVESKSDILVYKNFVLCLSLLCPFYTYYYEYKHKVQLEKGLLPFNNIVFFSQENFKPLKNSVSLDKIDRLLNTHFPAYQFISHFELMMNSVIGGIPHGAIDAAKPESSIFQFLFSPEQPEFVFR